MQNKKENEININVTLFVQIYNEYEHSKIVSGDKWARKWRSNIKN